MTTGGDGLVAGRVGWTEVAWDFASLLGRAFAIAIAVGILLTAAAVALPSPTADGAGRTPTRQGGPATDGGVRR